MMVIWIDKEVNCGFRFIALLRLNSILYCWVLQSSEPSETSDDTITDYLIELIVKLSFFSKLFS